MSAVVGQSRITDSLAANDKIRLLQRRIEALEVAASGDGTDNLAHHLADSVDSFIGFKEIVTTKKPCLRFVWILLISAGFIATVFFVYATIKAYLDNPTLTRVKVHQDKTYGYPPFVVCSRAWYDADKAYNLGLSIDGLKYALGYTETRSRVPRELDVSNVTEARNNFHEVFNRSGFESLAHFYTYIAVNLDRQFSKESFYNTTSAAYFVEGGLENASPVLGPSGGTCHLFQFEPLDGTAGSLIQPQSVRIKYGGLKHAHKWLLHFNKSAAARYEAPLMVPSGANVYLRVQGQVFTSLNLQDRPCEQRAGSEHSAADCMAECQNQFNKEQIGCQLFFRAFGNKRGLPAEFCNYFEIPPDENETTHFFSQSRFRSLIDQARGECFTECPRRCHRTIYGATLEGIDDAYDEFYGEKEEEVVRGQNMTVTGFHILHDGSHRGMVAFSEVRSFSFVELVSNVGGTLGLFLGGCLMTFAQLILFFGRYLIDNRKFYMSSRKSFQVS